MAFFSGCNPSPQSPPVKKEGIKDGDVFITQRLDMIEKQIKARGIKDPLVLKALTQVKRHLFVPKDLWDSAYNDYPLPIGYGQTISQPYIVALMTELLELKGGEKVLEIGTGSGYQAAVLAQIAGEVFTIEIVPELAQTAGERLNELGYKNIRVKAGDGYLGWPEESPFDAMIITAAPNHIPEPLLEQLKTGGVMVMPIGSYFQELYRIRKSEKGIRKEKVSSVRFVPMTGEAEKR
ncbi:protein-L-isoaspartate(D-aspartate) O-methyltransferase [bacterium]|nr:protein-L-isoaspartate(D-aspartate) O-methyltransferase [bacterium]